MLSILHLVAVEGLQILDLIRTLLRCNGHQPAMPLHESRSDLDANIVFLTRLNSQVDSSLLVVGTENVLSRQTA